MLMGDSCNPLSHDEGRGEQLTAPPLVVDISELQTLRSLVDEI